MTTNAKKNTNRPVKIGFTERGDGGIDLSWVKKVETHQVDGAIIVTKNLTDRCSEELLRLTNAGYKLMLHCGCTGWGNTWLEPNVPSCEKQLANLAKLINAGFPIHRIVLRVDPIIPTDEGLAAVERVIHAASAQPIDMPTIKRRSRYDGHIIEEHPYGNLLRYESYDCFGIPCPMQTLRWRISVFDQYRHVTARLAALGREPFYDNGRFQANDTELRRVLNVFDKGALYNDGGSGPFALETCAEVRLGELYQKLYDHGDFPNFTIRTQGCLSHCDFSALDIDPNLAAPTVNGQRRGGCLCLTNKCELLNNRKQCPHKCVYCYWRNNA